MRIKRVYGCVGIVYICMFTLNERVWDVFMLRGCLFATQTRSSSESNVG